MEKWGNDRVNALFEGNLPPNFRRPSDMGPITELKRFIRDKYEYKRFKIEESQIPPKVENNQGAFGSDEAFGSSSGGGGNVVAQAAPKPAASLIDFFDDPAPQPTPAPAAPAAPVSVFDSPGGAVEFDAFQSSAPAAPAATGCASDPFAMPSAPAPAVPTAPAVPAVPGPPTGAAVDPFFSPQAAAPQQQQQQQQVPPQQPKASNADIMSLFNAPAQMPNPGQMHGIGMMGGMPPQMGGLMGGMPGQMPGMQGQMPGEQAPGAQPVDEGRTIEG